MCNGIAESVRYKRIHAEHFSIGSTKLFIKLFYLRLLNGIKIGKRATDISRFLRGYRNHGIFLVKETKKRLVLYTKRFFASQLGKVSDDRFQCHVPDDGSSDCSKNESGEGGGNKGPNLILVFFFATVGKFLKKAHMLWINSFILRNGSSSVNGEHGASGKVRLKQVSYSFGNFFCSSPAL